LADAAFGAAHVQDAAVRYADPIALVLICQLESLHNCMSTPKVAIVNTSFSEVESDYGIRHPRESGGQGDCLGPESLDSRVRGNDGYSSEIVGFITGRLIAGNV